jgi:hypothetical protein
MTQKLMLFRLSLAISVCLLGTVSLFAQVNAAPDARLFAGAWRFEPKASTSQPAIITARTGEILRITVKEPLFRIVQISILTEDGVKIYGTPMAKGSKRSAVIDLYTDKRGETNAPHPFKPEYLEASQTYWKDGALYRHWSVKASAPGTPELKEVLTYKVSKDGKTLVIETVPEAGGTPVKYVYKRCDNDAC